MEILTYEALQFYVNVSHLVVEVTFLRLKEQCFRHYMLQFLREMKDFCTKKLHDGN